MLHQFSRTELLIGPEALAKLAQSKIAIFGIGGVGSFTVEALVRAGVGKLMARRGVLRVRCREILVADVERQILRHVIGDAGVQRA